MGILFSDSNEYLQNPAFLQSDIWFVSPLDIDIYVKKSFTYMQDHVVVSGWHIQPFNSNHRISDPFVCYKIQSENNQPFISTQWSVTFNLEKQWFLHRTMIKNLVQGIPIFSLLIMSLITLVLPPTLANIFRYISIIGLVITLFFYSRKFVKVFYNLLKNTWIDYDGVLVYYQNSADSLLITSEHVDSLRQLYAMNVQKVVLWQGALYCKQQVVAPNFWTHIIHAFSHNDDIDIHQKIFTTVQFIFSTPFISHYRNISSWL